MGGKKRKRVGARSRRMRRTKRREREEEEEEDGAPRVSSRGLPCERLFLDLVELLEGLFREESLQSLGRGSEMPRDAGSLEQAVRGHGRCCPGRRVRRRSAQKGRLSRDLREPSNVAQIQE